jgi:multiple sugar transport system permease protein
MEYGLSTTKSIMDRARKSRYKSLRIGLLFTAPVLLGYFIFVFVPLIVTAVMSFASYSIGSPNNHFIGLQNYIDMFTGQDIYFWPSVKATIFYVFGSVPLGIVFSYFMAILLNEKIKGRSLLRGVFYLPMVIPLASGCSIWLWMFQPDFGVINQLLKTVGLPAGTWLSSDTTVILSFIIVSVWLCGNTIVIFLAGLQEIPSHLYEAIEVDGGNAVHKLIYVTIPMSSSIIFFNTVMGVINAFQTFVQTAVLTPGYSQMMMGQPNNAGLLYVPYIYIKAFRFSQMGAASASAMVLLAAIAIFTVLFFRLQKSYVYYEGDAKKR